MVKLGRQVKTFGCVIGVYLRLQKRNRDGFVNPVIISLNSRFFNQFQNLICDDLAVLLQCFGEIDQKSVVTVQICGVFRPAFHVWMQLEIASPMSLS